MFFELREYRIKSGKRGKWVKLMEEKIIPFQVSKGMVVVGSFVAQEEDDLYIWIRRFESEEERERLYKEVYESEFWAKEVKPGADEMLDRETIRVTRLEATPKSARSTSQHFWPWPSPAWANTSAVSEKLALNRRTLLPNGSRRLRAMRRLASSRSMPINSALSPAADNSISA